MQNNLQPIDFYAPIVESINIIYPETNYMAKDSLKLLLSQIESLVISIFVLEKDYKFIKRIIKEKFKQFKTYHHVKPSSILKKELVSNAIKNLDQNIKELLNVCDEKYLVHKQIRNYKNNLNQQV